MGIADDPTDPMIVKPGLILRGICESSGDCIGKGKLICINLGMGAFDIGKEKHKGKCPKCQTKIKKIETFGYYKCNISI